MTTPSSIRIEKSVGPILEELAGQGATNTIKYFPSMAAAMVFAALVGRKYQSKRPIANVRENPISFEIFENGKLDSYVYLIGVSDKNSLDILNDEAISECFEIFEQYAHGGLLVISEWMDKKSNGLMEAILNEMADVASKEIIQEREESKPTVVITTRPKTRIESNTKGRPTLSLTKREK